MSRTCAEMEAEEGEFVVMVSHSLQQALELGNRAVIMHKGRIIDDIGQKEKQRI